MLTIKNSRLFLGVLILSLSSCGGNNQDATNNSSAARSENATQQKAASLASDLLGNYHGVQPGYFMKNKFGDDMVINGNKISVPSIDYKFLIKEDNTVSLQQINLEDKSRVYYEGTFKIISDNTTAVKIECALSDGKTSKPTYTLTINKSDKKTNCTGSNEPEFQLEKVK
jgi:hypothetical protein